MAKECLIDKQRKLAAKWEQLRKEEQAILELPADKRAEALAAFRAKCVKKRMFRSRLYNRCMVTGRARGYLGYFGLCRQVFREMAHTGQLPGVTKSSW